MGGASPALTKLALEGLGPFGLVVARQILGALFLIALAAVPRRWRGESGAVVHARWTRRDLLLLLTLSWVGFALPQILGAVGLERSSATHGALLSPLEPIGILVGAAFVLRESLGLAHIVAGAFGVAGTVLIVASGAGDAHTGDLRGDLLIAAGHLCWAIYTLAAKPLVDRHDPLRVAIFAALLSWIPLVPLAATESFDATRALPALAWVLLLAFLATAMGMVAWNRALREVSASTMALFVFVQPVVGLAIGVVALGEGVGWWAILGAALIVLGVAIATLRSEQTPSGGGIV
ncbi:MAG: DMT family transporter [Proteobacteria bacterium]|nr:DMT family transporter [Pseudomonadota bacterium]